MQKFNQYTAHLPYIDRIKENAHNELEEIKHNLTKSIVLNELRPGLMHWTNRLQTFLNEYGFCFKKNDHVSLIQLYLDLVFTSELDLVVVSICLSVLVDLLKKINTLSRDELKIEWKPIYKLYLRIHKISDRSTVMAPKFVYIFFLKILIFYLTNPFFKSNLEQVTFVNFVSYARIYFNVNATKEMLEEWRPLMCPFDLSMVNAFERFDLFLPTLLREHEINSGFKYVFSQFNFIKFKNN